MVPPGAEFSFDTGTLTLTLRQEMSVSDALSLCAPQKWVGHENGHVQDNQGVMRVHRDVLRNCPEPYIYEVNWGDTLSGIADFFYGRAGAWQTIYRANQGVIGRNPDLIRPGQRLTIPPTP